MSPTTRPAPRFVAHYDPLARDLTLVNPDQTPYLGAVAQSDFAHPLRIVLEIDSRCNLRCQYCSEGLNPPKHTLAKERIFALIDEAEAMQVPELTLRGGEATVHPDFFEIWDYAQAKRFTSTNLITNGFVLTPARVARMLENPRAKIIASLDGFPDVNALYRDPRQFARVLGWLTPALRANPGQIVLLSVIYRQNLAALPGFARAWAERGLRFYHLSPLKRLGRSEIVATNFVSYDEINRLQAQLDLLRTPALDFRPTVSCVALEQYRTNRTQHIPMPFFTELHFGTGVKVTPEGQVMVNRGIMFTKHFKHLLADGRPSEAFVEEKCLSPLGSVHDADFSFRQCWERSLGQRLAQAQLAEKHYDYYLGWLKTL